MLKGFFIGQDSIILFEDGELREYSRCDADDLSNWDEDWDEENEDFEDEDWDYNEDEGFDPYEGCYTWDC